MALRPERKGAFASAVAAETDRIAQAEEALRAAAERTKSGDIIELDIESIVSPPKHDRVGYSQATINEMADSMKSVGQLQPIVVRLLENGSYERIIGFRRILAAKKAGMHTIKAIILEGISDDVAALMMLSENMHREDPNLYDQTLKLIDYISVSLGISDEELIKQLYRYRNFDSNRLDDIEENEKIVRERIEIILKKTAKITLTTMVDRLRVLSLDEEIIHAMREKGLTYANAVELNKVKNKEELKMLLLRAEKDKPSKNEVKEWVKALKGNVPTGKEVRGGIFEIAKNALKGVTEKQIRALSDSERERLSGLLEELSALFSRDPANEETA